MKFTSTAFAPFREPLFRTLWICAFVSNVGTWMQNVGVSWVAATMSASPLTIALIQTASSLPAFVCSYPAGVVSDQTDRRWLLLWLQGFMFVVVSLLAGITVMNWLNLQMLLVFTFLVGIGSALTTPVWQAITPEVVSPGQLKAAIALNGVSFNLARAIGPALGGVLLVAAGIRSVFLFNAASFLVLMFGIYRWNNKPAAAQPFSFRKNAREGLRAVRASRPLGHLLIRTVGFTAFVSIIFALLPRLSKYEWGQTSGAYTWLWVSLGAGALVGSYFYDRLAKLFHASQLVFVSCVLLACCMLALTLTTNAQLLDLILFIAGTGWICATSTLNILAQVHSPAAFKGRFLAVNVTVFQGCLALSSALWGLLANFLPVLMVFRIAALAMVAFNAVLLLLPMEEGVVIPEQAVACADALLQYSKGE